MKLIFIRHGDPDYSIDSLTEKGFKEARLLSERVKKWDNITDIYCSPLGRAKDTASFSLQALNRDATELEWLKEFWYPVPRPQDGEMHVPWDFYPTYWTKYEDAYSYENWTNVELLSNEEIKPKALEVFESFDNLLKKYGYEREGKYYRHVKEGEEETLVFFCHLGVTLLIMSHLLSVSPFVLWHSFFVAPTSVTILGSEEQEKGFASFRVQVLGDCTHLHDGKENISSSGYFTDCFQG